MDPCKRVELWEIPALSHAIFGSRIHVASEPLIFWIDSFVCSDVAGTNVYAFVRIRNSGSVFLDK